MDVINIINGRRAGLRAHDAENVGVEATPASTGYTTPTKEGDAFLVTFGSDDGLNPREWSTARKVISFGHIVAIGFICTLAGSAMSPTYSAVGDRFSVNQETSQMSTSLYLFGFACGSIIMAPLSEEFGRLPVYINSMALFGLFHIGCACAKNMATLAICRFLAGFFGTSPLSNAGGSIIDIYTPLQTTVMFPIFGAWGFIGPTLGPLVGAALADRWGWRAVPWFLAVSGLVVALSCFLFMQESYAPVVLDHKARFVRRATGDTRYQSAHERILAGRSPFNVDTFKRPFEFAVREPIVTFFALYMTVVYVIQFAEFEAYPMVYQELYGFTSVQVGLTFIPIALGLVGILALTTTITHRHYARAETDPSIVITPESRLYTFLYACWLIPVGLFWLAWTCYASISPWASIPSGLFFGAGLMQCFIASYMYIMACYGSKSSSALSVLTFIRYNFSGLAVHAAEPWFRGMGLHWAFSLLAFISLALCVVPFVFYRYGCKIRSWSKFID